MTEAISFVCSNCEKPRQVCPRFSELVKGPDLCRLVCVKKLNVRDIFGCCPQELKPGQIFARLEGFYRGVYIVHNTEEKKFIPDDCICEECIDQFRDKLFFHVWSH